MPIRPDMKERYPDDWKLRSRFVRFVRAEGRCEWTDPDGTRCPAVHGEPSPLTGSKVILTTAHVFDHRPEAASLLNLAAWCQKHHLAYDRVALAEPRAARKAARAAEIAEAEHQFEHDRLAAMGQTRMAL